MEIETSGATTTDIIRISESSNMTVSSHLDNIIRSLVVNSDIVFKSQQRGESEPNENEKTQIGLKIFNENKLSFLMKFGRYLNNEQLKFFDQFAEEKNGLVDFEEIRIVLNDLRRNLVKSGRVLEIKNRRERILAATGISKNTLLKIRKEGREVDLNVATTSFSTPPKNRVRPKRMFTPAEAEEVKSIIYNFNVLEKRSPTIKGILQKMKDRQIDFTGCLSTLSRLIKSLGFRYQALQKMIKEDSYFSEIEMMKRHPLLYEQLVGQYLTEEEKRERDKFEMNENVTFVKILMEGIERDNAAISRQVQQQNEDSQMEESDSSDEERPTDEISVSTKSARPSTSMWGEFEEHKSKVTRSKKRVPMITASERRLLREEFITTVYQSFLDGDDKEFFDYSTVDDNARYDNITEMEHDAEDKYFDSEDPDEDQILREDAMQNESSEDELDIYMNALNQHPSVCELAKNVKNTL